MDSNCLVSSSHCNPSELEDSEWTPMMSTWHHRKTDGKDAVSVMKIPTVCFKVLAPPPEKPTNEAWIHWFINFESADVLIIPTPIFGGTRASFEEVRKAFFLFSHHNH